MARLLTLSIPDRLVIIEGETLQCTIEDTTFLGEVVDIREPNQVKPGGAVLAFPEKETHPCWICKAPVMDRVGDPFCRVCRDRFAPGTLIRQYAQDDVKVEGYHQPGTWRINYDQGETEPRPDLRG